MSHMLLRRRREMWQRALPCGSLQEVKLVCLGQLQKSSLYPQFIRCLCGVELQDKFAVQHEHLRWMVVEEVECLLLLGLLWICVAGVMCVVQRHTLMKN